MIDHTWMKYSDATMSVDWSKLDHRLADAGCPMFNKLWLELWRVTGGKKDGSSDPSKVCSLFKATLNHCTTIQSMINSRLSQQRFWHYTESRLVKKMVFTRCFQQRETKLAMISRNFSSHRKMFIILPLWPFVDYSLAWENQKIAWQSQLSNL